MFDYVEMFHNPVCNQVRNGMFSSEEFKWQQISKEAATQGGEEMAKLAGLISRGGSRDVNYLAAIALGAVVTQWIK